MSHLGNRLSALIDGELNAAERERVHAHLAGCAECRAEANALRALKKRMRGLGEVPPGDRLTQRLIGIAEPGAPVPPRRQARRMTGSSSRPRPGFRTVPRAATGTGPAARPPARPTPVRGPGRRRHPARYLALGVVSCAVAGLSVTAFTMGGGQQTPGPRITPQVQLYSVQHALTTGQLPPGGSSGVPAPESTGSTPIP
ncbi:MAG TPA: zf-HC2 domain-containing protein [Streptosporangiaceae bacterium]|jgi:anti-sigma factor RsiW|nr:zf-HC2 domain-containing protein [Streptosporangiaceae bacterium]